MKKYILNALALLFTYGLFAQGIYNNGGKIVIGSGTYVTINGAEGNYRNETNGTNASIDLSGKLIVKGNFINNVTSTDVLTTAVPGSEVIFSGSTIQTIGGLTAVPFFLPNVTVNNNTGIALVKDVQVNGSLTFINGTIDVGNNNFTFGPASIVAGTPSTSNMIIGTANGRVQKVWSSTGVFTFPIGEKTLSSNYLPVSMFINSGTFASGAVTGINMVNTKYNNPYIDGSYLNRYWDISQSGITNLNADAVFQYMPSDVIGTESSISTLRVDPIPFNSYNLAYTVLHQLSASGLTSFGTFTGGLSDNTLYLSSIMLEGLYNGAGTMRQAMDETGAHYPAGVADHITVELHDAINYSTIVYTANDVPLSTTGAATVKIPAIFNGSYFISIKHRNSLQTASATAKSFADAIINQSFVNPTFVFGGNLVQMSDYGYAIYGGDVNQDDIIDSKDILPVGNQSNMAGSGYIVEDVNGNGLVDSADLLIIGNNSNIATGAITP